MATLFTAGAVLPHTRELRITWNNLTATTFAGYNPSIKINGGSIDFLTTFTYSPSGFKRVLVNILGYDKYLVDWVSASNPEWGVQWGAVCGGVDGEASCSVTKYITLNTSSWPESVRTIGAVSGIAGSGLSYEDMDTETTAFNEGDTLPKSPSLKVLWGVPLGDWAIGGDPILNTTSEYFSINSVFEGGIKKIYREVSSSKIYLYNGGYNNFCGNNNSSSCETNEYFMLNTYSWSPTQRYIASVDKGPTGLESYINIRYQDLATWDVTFNSNGGSSVSSQTVANNATVVEPDPPTRSGYSFDGWFTDNTTFVNEWNFVDDEVNVDVTLYAKWVAGTYYLSYDTDGGSAVSTSPYSIGETLVEPSATTKAGYTFDGWYYDDGVWLDHVEFGIDTMPASDITIYAKWLEIFTVTFNSNSGSSVDSQEIDDGSLVVQPEEPVRSGYMFSGWFSDVGLTSVWDFDTDTVTADITLYAKWSAFVTIGISDEMKSLIMSELFSGVGTEVWHINLVDDGGDDLVGAALTIADTMDLSTPGVAVLSGEYEFEVPASTTIAAVKISNDLETEVVIATLAAPVEFTNLGYYVVLSLTITLG